MTKEEAIKQIIEASKVLGWGMLIPDADDDSELRGFIVGDRGYLDYIEGQLD